MYQRRMRPHRSSFCPALSGCWGSLPRAVEHELVLYMEYFVYGCWLDGTSESSQVEQGLELTRTKREQRDFILKAVSCQFHELPFESKNLVRNERFAWFGRWCC